MHSSAHLSRFSDRWSIGARTRIQSHAFVCELVTIGEDSFVGHGVMFINELFASGGPARGRKALWKRTQVGESCFDRLQRDDSASYNLRRRRDRRWVGRYDDIDKPGIYAGNPAKFLRTS